MAHSSEHQYQPRSKGFTQNLLWYCVNAEIQSGTMSYEDEKGKNFFGWVGKWKLCDAQMRLPDSTLKLAGRHKFKQTQQRRKSYEVSLQQKQMLKVVMGMKTTPVCSANFWP